MSMKERVKEIKKEMNSGERVYKSVITIGDMEAQGFMPLDLFDSEDFNKLKDLPIKLNSWDFLLKLLNAALVKGPDFNRDTPYFEFYTALVHALEAGFLLKSSTNSSSQNSENDQEVL